MAIRIGVSLLAAFLLGLTAAASSIAQPNLPEPRAVYANPATTALLVLDMSTRCNDPQQVCSQLAPVIASVLPKARAAHVFTIYTVSLGARGTALDLNRANADSR